MIKELLGNSQRHFNLIDKLDWYFMPVMNPDGYVHSNKTDRCWRKSRSCYDRFCLYGKKCTGVDLNRNWGYKWNLGDDFPCSNQYRGSKPFSEIETRNVRDFILAHKDKIMFFNTLHSYGQYIILPWSYTNKPPTYPTYNRTFELAQKGNEAMRKVHGTNYTIGNGKDLINYYAYGVSTDWALGEAEIPYVMCMELPPQPGKNDDLDCGDGFLLPMERIKPTAEEVWAFHEEVAKSLIEESQSVP